MAIGNILKPYQQGVTDFKNVLNGSNSSFLTFMSTKGIAGFEFDVAMESSIAHSADITENYVENNNFINDSIIIKPAQITMTGLIGEKVFKLPGGITGALRQLNSKLGEISAFTGGKTIGAIQKTQEIINNAQTALDAINTTIDNIQNVLDFIDNSINSNIKNTQQLKAYNKLKALMYSKQSLTVLTPWGYFDSMMIENMSPSQDAATNDFSTFSVTLKEVRFGELQLINYSNNLFNQTNITQTAPVENTGSIKGEPTELESIAHKGAGGLGNLVKSSILQ